MVLIVIQISFRPSIRKVLEEPCEVINSWMIPPKYFRCSLLVFQKLYLIGVITYTTKWFWPVCWPIRFLWFLNDQEPKLKIPHYSYSFCLIEFNLAFPNQYIVNDILVQFFNRSLTIRVNGYATLQIIRLLQLLHCWMTEFYNGGFFWG